MKRVALLTTLVVSLLCGAIARAANAPVLFVPLDDRPVTRQLPAMLGAISGITVLEPRRRLLGNYLRAGDPTAIGRWLDRQSAAHGFGSAVISTDMLAYGGLVASRIPGPDYATAFFRLGAIARLHRRDPHAWVAAFATVVRLAPTGVPPIGAAEHFFAAYPVWKYIQRYANLPDPLPTRDDAYAARLRALAGPTALDAYLAVRARNLALDRSLLLATGAGTIDRLVIGQDDAGAVGLHVPELAQLRAMERLDVAPGRSSIEPGADELGMVLVAHAMARDAQWRPRIAVRYSTTSGALVRDPLEFEPIGATIASLVRLVGGREVRRRPDIVLEVRVPHPTAREDDAALASMRRSLSRGRAIALVDLTFLDGNDDAELAFMQRLLHDGLAARLDAYASWNTDANSVGTALAEAVAAGAGRRLGTYDRRAQLTFTFDRILDDVYFHAIVRPELERTLATEGVVDHTYLLPAVAARTQRLASAALWQYAPGLLAALAPNDHIAALRITLPWDRTFECEIDPAIAPDIEATRSARSPHP
ncbi:MAG: DUF4127 family protein [Candidatus Eremiobacteraeota bacterium]|nr:DUF4127 family protein [Candidatus Eremiobacteraeota bacterium]NNM92494.1 DUF4127 family protein [Candidatus Eremiobacteraeota bacterium]